jgi:hypothetical protein
VDIPEGAWVEETIGCGHQMHIKCMLLYATTLSLAGKEQICFCRTPIPVYQYDAETEPEEVTARNIEALAGSGCYRNGTLFKDEAAALSAPPELQCHYDVVMKPNPNGGPDLLDVVPLAQGERHGMPSAQANPGSSVDFEKST